MKTRLSLLLTVLFTLTAFGAASAQFIPQVSPPLDDPGSAFGATIGDYDGNGLPDIYQVRGSGESNLLILQTSPGVFTDAAVPPLDDTGPGAAAAWADIDNDGDLDLYLVQNGAPNHLFQNQGGLVFTDITPPGMDDAGFGFAAVWGDYDNDGAVDLYLANNLGQDRLFKGDGSGGFTDVTAAAGLLVGSTDSRGASWADYDGDGLLDLYVANINGLNLFYHNNGDGTFSEVTGTPLDDPGSSMGVAWGDYDNDGDLDLYVAELNDPNHLFRNDGGGTFVDVSTAAGVDDVGTGVCPAWGDYDNDGYLDLYVANNGDNVLYHNNGNGTFTPDAGSGTADSGTGNAAVWGDIDLDGDLDLYVANSGSPNVLYQNDATGGNHWSKVNLDGTLSNRAAIGARVVLTVGGITQTRTVSGGSGLGSQNPLTVSFGLGSATLADRLEIHWPSGIVQVESAVGADQVLLRGEEGTTFQDITAPPMDFSGSSRGVAWGDYDNDGDLDVFVMSESGGETDHLFRNEGGGDFTDVTAGPLADTGVGAAATWIDVDNDGDLDLCLGNYSGVRLLRNDGAGVFADVTALPLGVDHGTWGMAWADVDGDGFPDLFLANDNFTDPDQLLLNQGDGTFTDATPPVMAQTGSSRAAAWGDYDNDGDLDLYVGREFDTNLLYRNEGGGVFTDVTAAPLDDNGAAQGADWIDVDDDGDLDLFLTRLSGTDILFRNDGGTFVDATPPEIQTGNVKARIAWGDYDNDGDLDFYKVLNNFGGRNLLFQNVGGGRFVEATAPVISGAGGSGAGQGGAWADFDGDGNLDFYLSNQTGNQLFRSLTNSGNHWLRVKLQGTLSNRDGIGARVRVVGVGLPAQVRDITDQSVRGAEPIEAHFGLGSAAELDTLEVRWPSGVVQTLTALSANQTFNLVEPSPYFIDATAATGALGDAGNGEGAAWADYDRDGDLDVFVTNFGQAGRLYRNDAGTFVDATAAGGFALDPGSNEGAAWGDVDNDGYPDLYVSVHAGSNVLYHNDQDGTFTDVTAASGAIGDPGNGRGVAWADYDGDGDLDLYLANYGEPNRLFRNDAGVFTDVAAGTPLADAGGTSGAVWGDYDNDGDPDLFDTNDAGTVNHLFRNDGGTFIDVSAAAGVGVDLPSLGASWGDVDNDGDLDLFITNFGAPNVLYRNDAGVFVDVAAAEGVAYNGPASQAAWGDFDHDGDLDLYLSNVNEPNILYRNDGATFTDVSAPPVDDPTWGQGATFADVDGDGDLDLYLVNGSSNANRLYRNVTPAANHWLQVKLQGTVSNASGIGARIEVSDEANTFIREVASGTGLFCQDPLTADFGLGPAATSMDVTVRWPSGIVQVLPGVATDQAITVVESLPPGISYVTPSIHPNAGTLSLSVHGANLDTVLPQAMLVNPSEPPDTLYGALIGDPAADQALFEFDLSGNPEATYYDLVVTNPGGDGSLQSAVVLYADPVTLLRSTTTPTFSERFPSWSPPASGTDSLLFISNRAGGTDLFMKPAYSLDTVVLPPLTTGFEARSPDWAPAADSLVYANIDDGGLYVIPGNGLPVPLTSGAHDFRPSWSPLGGQVVFERRIVDHDIIARIHTDGSGLTSLTSNIAGDFDYQPDWSPDGSTIVFCRQPNGSTGPSMVTMSSVTGQAGGITTLIPEDGHGYLTPEWSPDGKWIAFASDRSGNYDVWVVDARGPAFGLYQITTDPANDAEPTWSRDSRSIAFVSTRTGGVEDIYVATDLPMDMDTDGDGLPDQVDACPTEAPLLGQVDRDYDGCPDTTSNFRFVKFWTDDQLPVSYEIAPGGDPRIGDGSDVTEIAAGFDAWTAVPGVPLTGGQVSPPGGTLSNAVSGDGRNSITFADPDGFLYGILAITPTTTVTGDTTIGGRDYRPGQIVDADMLFNASFFEFSTPTYDPGPQAYDLRSVATHEFGHFFGLSHSSISTATMFYVVARGTGVRSLEEDDVVLTRRGYGAIGSHLSAEGRILRGEDGITPVVGAAVYAVSDASGDTLQMTISGMDGSYAFYEVSESFKIWVQPLDGGAEVNGLTARAVNADLESVAETDFLGEYWDGPAETNSDFGGTGTEIAVPGPPVFGADILTNPDLTGPVLTDQTPGDGATGVPVVGALSAKFDEKLDRNSISGSTVDLRDVATLTGVAGAAALLQRDSLLVFTPSAPLAYGTQYRFTLGPGLTDKFGNPMASAVTITFTTEAQPPVTLAAASPSEVPAGGTLVLSGAGFDPNPAGNQVNFTGAAAPATPFGATAIQLAVTVPADAASGPVTVTVGAETSGGVPIVVLPPKSPPQGNFLAETALGADPRKMAITPDGSFVYVATDQGVAAVDARPGGTFLDVTPVAVPGGCEGVAVLPDGFHAVAVGDSPAKLYLVDTNPASGTFNSIVSEASLVDAPLGVAAIPGSGDVLVSYADRVVRHSGGSGAPLGQELREWSAAGTGFLGDLAVSTDAGEAYATTTGGKVAVLGFGSLEEIVGQLSDGPYPREIAPLPAGGFLAAEGTGVLRRFDARGPQTASAVLSGGFSGLAASPEGDFAYAANFTLNRIDILDVRGAGLASMDNFATAVDPRDVVTGSGGRYIYVITGEGRKLQVFDTESGPHVGSVSPSSGRAGTLVTLGGTGFDPVPANNTVGFAGVPVTPVAADPAGTWLLVSQPAGAGTGPVTVTVAGQVSNGVDYRVVSRTNPGNLGLVAQPDAGGAQLARLLESPTGALLFAFHTDGSLTVFQADPTGSGFLRPVEQLTAAATGLSGAGVMAAAPDGRKLYVSDPAGSIAAFTVDENGTVPVARAGAVTAGGGLPLPTTATGMAFSPAGDRLYLSTDTNSFLEVSVAGDSLLNGIGLGSPVYSVAADPRGNVAYLGSTGATPRIQVVDVDPASVTYRTVIATIPVTGVSGPLQLLVTPEGSRLLALTGDLVPISQHRLDAVDIDPASGTYRTEVGSAVISPTATQPVLLLNHTGAVVFVVDPEGMSIRAADPFSLLPAGGSVLLTALSATHSLTISRDDSRLYVQGGGPAVLALDVTQADALNGVSGEGQVGVAGRPLAAPLVTRVVGADPEGTLVTYWATPTSGDFGYPDQMAYAAADVNGLTQVNYTAGPGTTGQDTVLVQIAGASRGFEFTVLPDTSLAPPQIVSVYPDPARPTTPGVNTYIAVDFSKAINPASVSGSTFAVRPSGGSALSGVYTYANRGRRVVFKSSAPLAYSSAYEFELTAGLQDYNGNALTNPGTFPFTTADPAPPVLVAADAPAARAGYQIVLSGSGFASTAGGNTVLFGPVAAAAISADPGAIQVAVPTSAASGPIRVAVGPDTSNAIPFTVLLPATTPVNEVLSTVDVPVSGQQIAVTPDGSRAYMTAPSADAVVPILIGTQVSEASVPVGQHPFGVATSPSGDRVYVSNFFSNTISVIDAVPSHGSFHRVIATIPTGLQPSGIAAHPDGRTLYVSNYGDSTLSVLDTDSTSASVYSAKAAAPVDGTTQSVVVTPDGGRVVVGTENGLVILDASDLSAKASAPIDGGAQSVVVTPDGGLAVVLTSNHQLVLVDIVPGSSSEGEAKATAPVDAGSQSVVVSPDGAFVYVTSSAGSVQVFQIVVSGGAAARADGVSSGISLQFVTRVQVGENPTGLAFDPSGSGLLLVVNSGSKTVSFINTTSTLSRVPASVDVTPNTLNLNSNGKFVTAYIQFPDPYTPEQVALSSCRLEGSLEADTTKASIGDYNGDGIPELALKFNRQALFEVLQPGQLVPVTVTGLVAGHPFSATDSVRVLRPHLVSPKAGDALMAGAATAIRWLPSPDGPFDHVDLYWSADAGASWDTVAVGTPDDSSYTWTAPDVESTDCLLMVAEYDAKGKVMGIELMLEPFAIAHITGERPRELPARFALLPAAPNPFRSSTRIAFDLPRDGKVTLRIYGLDGSLVRVLAEDRPFPAGEHALQWDGTDGSGRRAASGVYFVRIHTEADLAVRKVIRLQ